MKLPLTCLASDADNKYLAVSFDTHIQLIDQSSNEVLASTLSASAEEAHKSPVRFLACSASHVVSTAEDKSVKVWSIPKLELLSTRTLNRKANALKLDAAGTTIAIADKFGDVYSLPLLFTPIEIPAGEEEPKHEPKLGHVSVVTDLVLTENKEIVTCDRDEHVRVSRWPEGYDIVAFLLGHTNFVSALLLVQGFLLSAGGDPDIFVWDMSTHTRRKTVDVAEMLAYSIVKPERPEKKAPGKKKGGGKGKNKGKGKASEEQTEMIIDVEEEAATPVAEEEVVQELEKAESPEALAPAEVDDKVEPVEAKDDRSILIRKMLNPQGDLIAFSSIGSTAVGFFHLDTETPDVKYLNLYHPVLDMCLLKSGKLLVSLDLSHADPHAKEEGFPGDKLCRVLEVKDGQLTVADSPLVNLLDEKSLSVTEQTPFPVSATLYSNLYLLHKDPTEQVFDVEEKIKNSGPRQKKVRGKTLQEKKADRQAKKQKLETTEQ